MEELVALLWTGFGEEAVECGEAEEGDVVCLWSVGCERLLDAGFSPGYVVLNDISEN